jgi:hypothetical protein
MYCSNNDDDDCTHYETRTRVGMPPLEWWGLEELLYNNEGTTAYSASPFESFNVLNDFHDSLIPKIHEKNYFVEVKITLLTSC